MIIIKIYLIIDNLNKRGLQVLATFDVVVYLLYSFVYIHQREGIIYIKVVYDNIKQVKRFILHLFSLK